jgi:hypothetical protein
MTFLGSIWTKLLAAGAIVLGILLAFLRIQGQAKQAGRDEVLRKDAEAEAAARQRMQEAAADAPKDDAELVDTLRKGKL